MGPPKLSQHATAVQAQTRRIPQVPLELVDRIFRLLDKQTLSSCSLVHSSWLSFARALFWDTIYLDVNKVPLRRFSLLHPFVYEPDFSHFISVMYNSPDVAKHVRTLILRGGKYLKYPHQHLPPIHAVWERLRLSFNATDIRDVVLSMPELCELELWDLSIRFPHDDAGFVSPDTMLPQDLIPLTRLAIHQDRDAEGTGADGLVCLLGLLDPVDLELTIHNGPRPLGSSPDPTPFFQLHNRRITSITMKSTNPGMMFLLRAIPHAPFMQSLHSLDLQFTYPEEVALFSRAIGVMGHNIRSLKLDVATTYELGVGHQLGILDFTILGRVDLAPCINLESIETSVTSPFFYSGGLIRHFGYDEIVRFLRTVRAPLREVVLKLYLSFDGSVAIWDSLRPRLASLNTALSSLMGPLQSITLVLVRPTRAEARFVGGVVVEDVLASFFPAVRSVLRVELPLVGP